MKAVAPAALGVEVDEFPGLPRVTARRLQVEMLDEHGRKAFLVFDFH